MPIFLAAPVLLAACGGGPGTEAQFVEMLSREGNLDATQAECIADAVFDEYGQDDDALGKISGAESYEWLIGPDGVEGFGPFYDGVVANCTTVGPTQ